MMERKDEIYFHCLFESRTATNDCIINESADHSLDSLFFP